MSDGVMPGFCQHGPEQRAAVPGASEERPSALNRELTGHVGVVIRHESAPSCHEPLLEDSANPPDKLRCVSYRLLSG